MPRKNSAQITQSEIDEFQKLAVQTKESADLSESKIENTQVKPVSKLKENEVQLSSGKIIKIKPVKIKDLKNGSFNTYRLIENMGLVSLLRYIDGDELVLGYLKSTVDETPESINLLYDDLSIEDISNIIQKSKKINGIKDEDFQMPPTDGMA